MLLNVAKCQSYSFCRFWVIKGKPTEEGERSKIPPTQIIWLTNIPAFS